MSATVAAAVKAAIVILSNEEARKKVGWGIVAILSPLIVLVVLLCAILSGTSQHNVSAVELCFHGRLHFPPAPRRSTKDTSRICGTALTNWTK